MAVVIVAIANTLRSAHNALGRHALSLGTDAKSCQSVRQGTHSKPITLARQSDSYRYFVLHYQHLSENQLLYPDFE
jgi:hypothetical protein